MSSTTSLKLDDEMKERIRRLANIHRRTPHWVMREAIHEYVEREERCEQNRHAVLEARPNAMIDVLPRSIPWRG